MALRSGASVSHFLPALSCSLALCCAWPWSCVSCAANDGPAASSRTLASFALAYALRDLIAPNFPRTLAFVAPETAITFAVMLAGGVLASLMAVWHALRTPAQLALGG
jgi:hypothetical protein